jgi:hypothetical protein
LAVAPRTEVIMPGRRVVTSGCPQLRCDGLLGFADETCRAGRYRLAAVLVCACSRQRVTRNVRRNVRPGQARVHFAKMQDRDRRSFLSALLPLPVTAVIVEARGIEVQARSACWSQLVPRLIELNVQRLTIERTEGAELRDRRDILEGLVKLEAVNRLKYSHALPRDEPLLWVADAVAWSVGRGGEWATRVRRLLL